MTKEEEAQPYFSFILETGFNLFILYSNFIEAKPAIDNQENGTFKFIFIGCQIYNIKTIELQSMSKWLKIKEFSKLIL